MYTHSLEISTCLADSFKHKTISSTTTHKKLHPFQLFKTVFLRSTQSNKAVEATNHAIFLENQPQMPCILKKCDNYTVYCCTVHCFLDLSNQITKNMTGRQATMTMCCIFMSDVSTKVSFFFIKKEQLQTQKTQLRCE